MGIGVGGSKPQIPAWKLATGCRLTQISAGEKKEERKKKSDSPGRPDLF